MNYTLESLTWRATFGFVKRRRYWLKHCRKEDFVYLAFSDLEGI